MPSPPSDRAPTAGATATATSDATAIADGVFGLRIDERVFRSFTAVGDRLGQPLIWRWFRCLASAGRDCR